MVRCHKKGMDVSGLVNILAVMLEVGIQVVVNEPSRRCWQMKWWRMSMCLVCEEMTSVLAIVHVLWLSHSIEKDVGEGKGVRERKSFIHITSLTVQRPTKTAWSASHCDRPRVVRVVERSLYHSYDDCSSPYSATRRRRTVEGSFSGYPGICFTKMS